MLSYMMRGLNMELEEPFERTLTSRLGLEEELMVKLAGPPTDVELTMIYPPVVLTLMHRI